MVASLRNAYTRPPETGRVERSTRTRELVSELAQSPPTTEPLLDELVRINMCIAASIAARYRGRGISDDDLEQVAYLALVGAAQAFDPTRGSEFLAFAVPSIRGQLRRHFRDHGWVVQPPRKIQELKAELTGELSELASMLGRMPTASELAEHVNQPTQLVEEALAANSCFRPTSLDVPMEAGSTVTLGELLGVQDPSFDTAEARMMLAPLIRGLQERERRIVLMRFVDDCTQREIAEAIGVTQMQVSRLLRRILEGMRADLEGAVQAVSPRVPARAVPAQAAVAS